MLPGQLAAGPPADIAGPKNHGQGYLARRRSARTTRAWCSLVEIGVDKNTTVVFPAPLMSTIEELGSFLACEAAASTAPAPGTAPGTAVGPGTRHPIAAANGAADAA